MAPIMRLLALAALVAAASATARLPMSPAAAARKLLQEEEHMGISMLSMYPGFKTIFRTGDAIGTEGNMSEWAQRAPAGVAAWEPTLRRSSTKYDCDGSLSFVNEAAAATAASASRNTCRTVLRDPTDVPFRDGGAHCDPLPDSISSSLRSES
eukprot:362020-Chlamydomonas_euryale.AAC.2